MTNLIDTNVLAFIKMVAEEKFGNLSLTIARCEKDKDNFFICTNCDHILSHQGINYIEYSGIIYLLEFIKCSKCREIINYLPRPIDIEAILEELDKSSKLDDVGKYKLLSCIDSILIFSEKGKSYFRVNTLLGEPYYKKQMYNIRQMAKMVSEDFDWSLVI